MNISENSFFNAIKSRINEERTNILEQWNNPKGTNTKHFIVDNLISEKDAYDIYNAFPRDGSGFFNRETFRESKKTSANLSTLPEILSNITYAFQNKEMVNLISDITGFSQLKPDPKLYAGGLSMMFEGDYLNPHIDNSHDSTRNLYRRLNLLFYVNPEWKLSNGGNFELWNQDRSVPKTLVSNFNRLVVMETNKKSWHSVSPVKIKSPRCCVSNYYFSKISPDNSDYFHVTSFTGRPEEKINKVVGFFDNFVRNIISKTFKIGRGRDLMNKDRK